MCPKLVDDHPTTSLPADALALIAGDRCCAPPGSESRRVGVALFCEQTYFAIRLQAAMTITRIRHLLGAGRTDGGEAVASWSSFGIRVVGQRHVDLEATRAKGWHRALNLVAIVASGCDVSGNYAAFLLSWETGGCPSAVDLRRRASSIDAV